MKIFKILTLILCFGTISMSAQSVADNALGLRLGDSDGFGAGNIGIEYDFNIPLLLSLDFRPEIGVAGYDDFSDNFDFDIALGIRYQF